MKLALHLLSFQGEEYLPYLFASLKKQTFQDWKVYFLDNGSIEPHTSALRQAADQAQVPLEFFRSEKNLGFTLGNTLLFEKSRAVAEYVLLLNDDAFIEPDYLEHCVAYLDAHPECAAAEGVILRWNFENLNQNGGRTKIIDTLGFVKKSNFSVNDIGAGETLTASPTTHEVFGVSGCLPMYRISALLKASPEKDIFDPTFFAYKEDVDLAFRLRAAGYTAALVAESYGYHRRTYSEKTILRPKNLAAYLSYRNHVWLLLAHLRGWSYLSVIPYETVKLLYWLAYQPSFVAKAWRETRANWRSLMAKRAFVRNLK